MLEVHNKQKQHKTKKHSIPFLKSIPLALITVLNCTFNYLTWLILDQQESVHYLCVYKQTAFHVQEYSALGKQL